MSTKRQLGRRAPSLCTMRTIAFLVVTGALLTSCASQVVVGGDINAPYHAARHHHGYTADDRASLDRLVAVTSVQPETRSAHHARHARSAAKKVAHAVSATHHVAETATVPPKPWWRVW